MTPSSTPPEHQGNAGQALAGVLDIEADIFAEMTALVAAQRGALLAADAPQIERLSARLDTLSTRFRLMDSERVRLERALGNLPAAPPLERARASAQRALALLLREAAVAGTVVERLGETILARTSQSGLNEATLYGADGATQPAVASGARLSTKG